MKSLHFFILIACPLIVVGTSSYHCYQCFYDAEFPNIPGTQKACIEDPFDGSKIKNSGGFNKCYKAVIYDKDGNLVSAHRDGNFAAIDEFAAAVSRLTNNFEISYCESDYCNGSTSLALSLTLIASSLLAVRAIAWGV